MVWEGATDDDFEITLSFTDPTADRTWTFPDGSGGVMLTDNADTSTAKTFTTPTITSAVLILLFQEVPYLMKILCQVILLLKLQHNKVLRHM